MSSEIKEKYDHIKGDEYVSGGGASTFRGNTECMYCDGYSVFDRPVIAFTGCKAR